MEQRLACGRELIELGGRTGVRVFAAVGGEQLWWCNRELGELHAMRCRNEEAAAHLYVPGPRETFADRRVLALLRGDLRAAEQQAHELSDSPRAGAQADGYAKGILATVGALRGRLDDPTRLATIMLSWPSALDLPALIGRGLATTGRRTEAAAHIRRTCTWVRGRCHAVRAGWAGQWRWWRGAKPATCWGPRCR